MATEERPQSRCAECGQTDDHPKHMVLYPPEFGGLVERHMDCCPPAECGNGICAQILEHAGDKRGYDLLEHIQTHAVYDGELEHLLPPKGN